MNTAEFLTYLRDSGAHIWVEEGKLRCRAPNGMSTPALHAELAERKDEILAFLAGAKAAIEDASRPIEPASRDAELPLSFAQKRLWFLDQLTPHSAVYNIISHVRLSGRLLATALEQSLGEIIRRHEVLRTRFVNRGGKPALVIDEARPARLAIVDLSGLDRQTCRELERRLARDVAERPFDLALGPLLRVRLLRLSESEHLSLFAMSHIISDGWSMEALYQELTSLYNACRQGEPSKVADLPIQYSDYAQWQQERLQDGAVETQLAYWKRQMDGADAALELPSDRPRPLLQTYKGAIRYLPISKSLTAEIKVMSGREGATLFMVLLGVFYALLSRYTGDQDILVGTPIAGRDRRETEGMIGLFVNTVVIRIRSSKDWTFRQLISHIRDVTLGAFAHQDLPFEKLVEELRPERNLSRFPLFQVMFVLHNTPRKRRESPGLKFTPVLPDTHTAKFDLTFEASESEQGLGGAFEYNTDLFDDNTIARMQGHYHNLLQKVAADPGLPIRMLPLLTEAERHQALIEWNDTKTDAAFSATLQELFEKQAERTPDAVAVVTEEETLTYGELNRRANQLAHYLKGLGVGPDAPVGVFTEQPAEMVTGLLGILKSGGAYLPLDPTFPRERIAFMLEDARVSTVLTQQKMVVNLPEQNINALCLDTDWDKVAWMSEERLVRASEAGNLAYVIYTSGSTGKPKGAMLPHQGVVNCLSWMQETYRLDEQDRFLFKTSLNFDPSVWEIFWTLSVGATIVAPPRADLLDQAKLVSTIITHGVTSIYFVPSMLRVFLDGVGIESCVSLKRVICGGESLPPETLRRYWDRLGAEFHHSYGPTEVSIAATETRCEPGMDGNNMGIGRALANTEVYTLDQEWRSAPVGVTGELFIGGVGVGRGYVNHADLTAERFVPHLFSEDPGSRLYRTGDLVKVLTDGRIEFLGRVDHQVKLRGFRIELEEIGSTLTQHPSIREAVVLAREDEPGEKRLVAYVVADREPAPTDSELRRFSRERLPDYMIPAAFIHLDGLPTMSNGKLDRRALPAPGRSRPLLEEECVLPRTEIERTMARIWQELLQIDQVGIHDNYFDLGGNSLLMVQAHSKLVEALNRDLSLVDMFMYPTIASLSEYLSLRKSDQTADDSDDAEVERSNANKHRLQLQLKQSRQITHESGHF